MRALFAVALIALGLAGVTGASAVEPAVVRSADYSTHHIGYGTRAARLVIYDVQSGVVVRAYWRTPWRNRHYFPTTGEKPEIGRNEDLSAAPGAPKPAETFQRSWSTPAAFQRELPRAQQPPQVPDAVKP
jgi:hypothetical protein